MSHKDRADPANAQESTPDTIIDDELAVFREPPISPRAQQISTIPLPALRQAQRRRAVGALLHPMGGIARVLAGSLAENLHGTPPTEALRLRIVRKCILLFRTVLPERDDRWLRATHVAHDVATAVIAELQQGQEATDLLSPTSPESVPGTPPAQAEV